MVGIAEQLSDLPPADLAELINQLTIAEAAAAVSLLPVPRAIELCDQPTMRRRAAILEQLDPARVAQFWKACPVTNGRAIIRRRARMSGIEWVRNLAPEIGKDSRGC